MKAIIKSNYLDIFMVLQFLCENWMFWDVIKCLEEV